MRPPTAWVLGLAATLILGAMSGTSAATLVPSEPVKAPVPEVSLSASVTPTELDLGQNITFQATLIGGTPPVGYLWHMGNGQALNGPEGAYLYPSTGTYTVQVWANDSASNDLQQSWTVTVVTPPELSAQASLAATDTWVPVDFSASLSDGIPPYEYQWIFGPGEEEVGSSVSHAFDQTGTYEVRLNATDGAGVQRTWSTSVVVNANLTLTAQASSQDVTTSEEVTFTSISTGGTDPESVAWVFGDGGTSNLATPSHVYSASGRYVVRVWVNDSVGETVNDSVSIIVTQATTPPGVNSSQGSSKSPPFSPTLPAIVSLGALVVMALVYLIYRRRRWASTSAGRPPRKVRISVGSSSSEDTAKDVKAEDGDVTPGGAEPESVE